VIDAVTPLIVAIDGYSAAAALSLMTIGLVLPAMTS